MTVSIISHDSPSNTSLSTTESLPTPPQPVSSVSPTKQSQPSPSLSDLVYLLILQRQIHPLSRLFPLSSICSSTHAFGTPPLLSEPNGPPPKLDLFVALCCPPPRETVAIQARESPKKRKRRYSCQPADFAADSALREADERAVALDAAVAVLSEPEQILVNTEELVKNWKQSTRDRADQTPTTPGNRGSSASPPAGSTTPSPHSPQRVSGRAGLVRCEEYRW
ncbi:hypothetical protein BLNAU_20726 [Blattamonas nauphoetae]|uniref:Uncharacterized protein n=1 Tax=Blattamonas nauphoetae TaxID=2049346 RepID=A0ABQ9WXY6_9EUKA|nr:hypothetical protein BLNAU_20726 [Blattamonas nauphoetae]